MLTRLGIIAGIFIGGIVGGCCSFAINAIFEIKNIWVKAIISIITCIMFFTMVSADISSKEKNFNNGFCVKCGEKYENVERKNSSTYYECPSCNYRIRL